MVEYPGLKQLYDTAPNIPEDIDRMCEKIFQADHRFAIFTRPTPSNDGDISNDLYLPVGIPSEVKMVVHELVITVCQTTKSKRPPGAVKKKSAAIPKTPKRQVAKKISLGEDFARNVTLTVNKLDDRLTNVTDEIRAEVITNVHNGLTRATEEIRTNLANPSMAEILGNIMPHVHRTLNQVVHESQKDVLSKVGDVISPIQNTIGTIQKEISEMNSLTVNMRTLIMDQVHILIDPLVMENNKLKKEIHGLKETIVVNHWNNASRTQQVSTPPRSLRIPAISPGRRPPTLPLSTPPTLPPCTPPTAPTPLEVETPARVIRPIPAPHPIPCTAEAPPHGTCTGSVIVIQQ